MEGSGWVRQYIFQNIHGCRLRHLSAPLGVEHEQNWRKEFYLIADKIALLTVLNHWDFQGSLTVTKVFTIYIRVHLRYLLNTHYLTVVVFDIEEKLLRSNFTCLTSIFESRGQTVLISFGCRGYCFPPLIYCTCHTVCRKHIENSTFHQILNWSVQRHKITSY